MLSSLEFGSFLVYPTRDSSKIGRDACAIVDAIKADRLANNGRPMIEVFAHRVAAALPTTPFCGLFAADIVLVPVPRRAPLQKNALWPGMRICDELVAAGVAAKISPLVTRATAVPSSRSAGLGNRPLPATHVSSFSVASQKLLAHSSFLLVDDCVTLGSTAIGAASALDAAYPGARIALFAAARTRGFAQDVPSVVDPFLGMIDFDPMTGKASRRDR